MGLTLNTNCGFVTTAPTADPATGLAQTQEAWSSAMKDTAPVGATSVTEIGWWVDNATQEANFDVAIYTHDAGNNRPDDLIGTASTAAKGTSGTLWKSITGLSIPITAGTVYWIGVQLDTTATSTNTERDTVSGSRKAHKYSPGQTALPDPWGVSDQEGADQATAFYAVYASAPDYTKVKVNIGDVFKSASNVQINIGDVWKTATKMEVNIGDVWKTSFS